MKPLRWPSSLDDRRRRQRAERHADREAGDRRRRQRLVGAKQIMAGQRAERNRDRRRRADDRLRDARISAVRRASCALASGRHEASLPRPSPRTRRETRSSTALTSFGSSSS